jgi:hypothetical protein
LVLILLVLIELSFLILIGTQPTTTKLSIVFAE